MADCQGVGTVTDNCLLPHNKIEKRNLKLIYNVVILDLPRITAETILKTNLKVSIRPVGFLQF